MISAFDVYLFDMASGFKTFSGVFFIGLFMLFIAIACVYADEDKEEKDKKALKKFGRIIFVMSIIFGAAAVFIPSTSTLYKMYIIPKFANSEFAKQLPDYLNQYIKNELIKNEKK